MCRNHYLILTTSIPVDSDAFAATFKGEAVDLINIVNSRIRRQVHSLGYCIVCVFLECRLNSDVPLRCDFVCRDENLGQFSWDFWDFIGRNAMGKSIPNSLS
jgi:hypothetical protein